MFNGFSKGDYLDIEVESGKSHQHREAINTFYRFDNLFSYMNFKKAEDVSKLQNELNSEKKKFLTSFGIVAQEGEILVYAQIESGRIGYFTLDNSSKLISLGKFIVRKDAIWFYAGYNKPLFKVYFSKDVAEIKRDTEQTKQIAKNEFPEEFSLPWKNIGELIHEDSNVSYSGEIEFVDSLTPEYINPSARSLPQSFRIEKGNKIPFTAIVTKKEFKAASKISQFKQPIKSTELLAAETEIDGVSVDVAEDVNKHHTC